VNRHSLSGALHPAQMLITPSSAALAIARLSSPLLRPLLLVLRLQQARYRVPPIAYEPLEARGAGLFGPRTIAGNIAAISLFYNERMCELVLSTAASLLPASGDETTTRAISVVLARFGAGALEFASQHSIRIVPLSLAQRYATASRALRRLGIDVDAWPVPPAGLFVVEERTVYLRSASPMTVAHEFGHALDCALGGGVYRSGYDLRIRAAFNAARSFITPYAASGLDEYFAESMRAYAGVNDSHSPWPKATRDRLARIDPAMFEYLKEIFQSVFCEHETNEWSTP
jgi:hypothetical protein